MEEINKKSKFLTNNKYESYIIISLIQILFIFISSIVVFNKLNSTSIISVLVGQLVLLIPIDIVKTLSLLTIYENDIGGSLRDKLYSNIELFISMFIVSIINFIYIFIGIVLIAIIGFISKQVVDNSYIIITLISILVSIIQLLISYLFAYSQYIHNDKFIDIRKSLNESLEYINKYKYKILNISTDMTSIYINLASLIITYSSIGIIIVEIYNNASLFTLNIFSLIVIISIQIIILCTQLSYLNIILENKNIYETIGKD